MVLRHETISDKEDFPFLRPVLAVLRRLFAIQEMTILVTLTVITLLLYMLNPAMLNSITISSILRTIAFPGMIGMGLVLLMICGEIDLSTGSVMSLAAVSAAWLMKEMGLPLGTSIGVALGLSLLVGLLNGLLTVKMEVNSIIVTMGTMWAVRGLSYWLSGGRPIYPLPSEVGMVGDLRPLGLSVAFWVMIGLMVVVQIILSWTRWGGQVFATGGNATAAEICGINTNRVKLISFMVTSLLAGCAGLLTMSQMPLPSGDPIFGRSIELQIIVGVVLGGAGLFGGRGSAVGSFLGMLLVQIVSTGLVLIHIDANWQVPVQGILLVSAASIDVLRHRRRE